MRATQLLKLMRIGLFAILLAGFLPAVATAQSADTSFTSDEHGVTITWEETWLAEPLDEGAISGVTLDLENAVFLQVFLMDAAAVPPEAAIEIVLGEDSEIIEDNRDDEVPSVEASILDLGVTVYIEGYTINDGETTVLVSLMTLPTLQGTAVEVAQSDVAINGNPPFQGAILDGDADATPQTDIEATPEATDLSTEAATPEATEETSRTSRTPRGGSETPEATADATEETSRTTRGTSETPEATDESGEEPNVISRTPRGGSDASETPEVTEDPTTEPVATEEPTEEPDDTTLSQGLDSYTSELYGFTISFDPNIWEIGDTFESATIDGLRLDGDRSTVFFIGTDEYGADPVGCLIAEDEYYSTSSESISNWEVATDAEGEPLWYESDELAWGVFRYTFTSSDGSEVEFVDYISCESIPGQDAVMLVQLTSTPEDYNENLDLVLDVLDTIEFE